jgi:type 1 fimbria pilin
MATNVTGTYFERQYELTAVVEFDYTTFTEDEVYNVLDLPAGAVVTGISLQVKTAWDNSVPVFNVGNSGTDPDEFIDGVSLAAEANFPVSLFAAADDANLFTGDANVFPAGGTINVLYAATSGVATAGAANLIVKYVVPGRGNENQG